MQRKLPKLQHVKFTRAKSKVYAYFDTGRKNAAGRTIYAPLPAFGSEGFFSSYGVHLGHRNRKQDAVTTVNTLANLYQRSDDFAKRSEGTKRIYTITLKKVLAEFGDFPLDDVTRALLYRVLDDIPGAASRNIFVAVLGVLYRYARSRDLTEANPTKDVPKAKTGEHEPWPDEILQAALESDNLIVRRAVNLLYYTGQRIGDAVALRWSDIRNGRIVMTQRKTGKVLHIHMHGDLVAEMARTPKNGLTIIADENGKPVSADRVRKALQAFAADLGHSVVPHGLRKNAVISLLEAGCTIPEVQAITGQSVEMVLHYAKKVDQGALSEAAIIKMEGHRNR